MNFMNDTLQLSFTDFYCKEDLVSKIDQMASEYERLKRNYFQLLEEKNALNAQYSELQSESRKYQVLYRDILKKWVNS